jgi:catechol 2,3-dioxygenase-like lactoylglutathione lyase family enzyme
MLRPELSMEMDLMQPRLSLVTLGVADIARARTFYATLGFRPSSASNDTVVFMEAGGVVLALFGRAALAEDASVQDGPPGFSGITLAHNCASENEVDAVLAEAVAAGARLVKPAQKAFWGGYSGYFADPDGHLWEVAFNPFFPLDAQGRVVLPPPTI